MKKVLICFLTFSATFSYASDCIDEPCPSDNIQEKFFGICKGNAVVVNAFGQLEYINMGDPGKDIITDGPIECAELFGNFVKTLAMMYPKVVTSASSYN